MAYYYNLNSKELVDAIKPQGLFETLERFFANCSISAYLVGGSVRDLILGRDIQDLDIAIGGDAHLIGEALAGFLKAAVVPLGHTHGLIRLVLTPQNHRPTIDISSFSGDITEDLVRRDFTVDAMAIPIWTLKGKQEGLIDPVNGIQDLAKRTLRVVTPLALEDDPARLIRAARLAAQLNFSIEPITFRLVKENAHLIGTVATERVRDELMKLLDVSGAAQNLRLLDDLGLLRTIIPELEITVGVEQPREHHWDVFYHCVETAGAVEKVLRGSDTAEPAQILTTVPWHIKLDGYFAQEASDGFTRRALLKFTGLLHDIAKPQTKTLEDSGRIRFFGHSEEGAEMAAKIMRRLRFSGRGIDMVHKMIKYHLRPSQMAQAGEMPTRRAIYKYCRDLGDVAIDTLYLNLADYLAARGPSIDVEAWKGHCEIVSYVLSFKLKEEEIHTVYKLVNGHDIMQLFGLPPGPGIGELLRLVEEAQGSGEITTREEALALLRANLQARKTNA